MISDVKSLLPQALWAADMADALDFALLKHGVQKEMGGLVIEGPQ